MTACTSGIHCGTEPEEETDLIQSAHAKIRMMHLGGARWNYVFTMHILVVNDDLKRHSAEQWH